VDFIFFSGLIEIKTIHLTTDRLKSAYIKLGNSSIAEYAKEVVKLNRAAKNKGKQE
jgi:hypothetical protein